MDRLDELTDEDSGVLNINADNEGLDTELHLTINGGNINIVAHDDGINTNEDGVSVTTINGGTLHIRGKIDRINLVNAGEENYLTILDYTSSAHSFNFSDAYYGLAMQMITYLDVALLNAD